MDILLVEDDPVTALYVTEGLQAAGHAVHWAPTGPDGLEQARRGEAEKGQRAGARHQSRFQFIIPGRPETRLLGHRNESSPWRKFPE